MKAERLPVESSGHGMRSRRRVAAVLSFVWMALIFFLSEMPGTAVPGRFGWLGHLFMYAVLATLYFAALDPRLRDPRSAALAVVLASAYGVTDEIHQLFTPGRSSDPADWAIDTLGALVAAGLIVMIGRRASRGARPVDDRCG